MKVSYMLNVNMFAVGVCGCAPGCFMGVGERRFHKQHLKM